MFSWVPVFTPISRGIANALASVALASLGAYFFFQAVPSASPELLRSAALVGTSLVLAYVVEVVWLVSRVEVDDEYEEWLGFVTDAGIAGFLGVVLALLLSAHRAAGHSNFIDEIGLAWVVVSLLILGTVLVVQPLLAHRFSAAEDRVNDQLP